MSAYAGAAVTVLGADGFIGRWVTRRLLAAGARVVGLVKDQSAARRVFARPGSDLDVDLHEIDLECRDGLAPALRAGPPRFVFNLAGYGVARTERDARRMLVLNTELPVWIVEALADTGARLVHVGSGAEYGPLPGNLDEAGPCAPDTEYGRTKLAGTRGLVAAARRIGVAALVARPFTVYGPGEHARRLLPTLLDAAVGTSPVELSEGLQRRDFIYVEDVAEGLLRLAAADFEPGTIVNLGTGALVRVRDFVLEAASVLGIPPERLHFGAVPSGPYEMDNDPVALDRLRALTGWTPTTGIRDGVRRTRSWSDA